MSISEQNQEFLKLLNQTIKVEKMLKDFIREREQLIKKNNQNNSLLKLDQQLRNLNNDFTSNLNKLQNLLNLFENNPLQYGMFYIYQQLFRSTDEVSRKRNQISQLQNSQQQIQKNIDIFQRSKNTNSTTNNLFDKKQAQGDYANMSDIELQQMQHKQYQDQNQKIDQLHNITGTLGKTVKVIGQTLSEDNVLLDDLDKKLDKTNTNMIQTKGKMQSLLESSNTCTLWIIIIVQLFIFLFLISM